MPKTLSFFKMHGCGNDFVVVDNRELNIPVSVMSDWAKAICAPHTGVGADGLCFLENSPENRSEDYIWQFYNTDGSRAEMCGNASRCAALLAVRLGLAGPVHTLGTDAGPIRAKVDVARQEVKVELSRAKDLRLNTPLMVEGQERVVHFVNTGVPHAVVFFDSQAALESLDILKTGAAIRYHNHFAPAGTNANFAWVCDKSALMLRTYERGVEAETLACGTGSAATVFIAHALGLCDPQVAVQTSGGETLGIDLEGNTCFLSGKAVTVFTGNLNLDAVL